MKMQIFFMYFLKMAGFCYPFPRPHFKRPYKMYVYVCLKIYKSIRRPARKMWHKYYSSIYMYICVSDVYSFIVSICLLFDLAAHPFRKFPFSSVYRRVRERSSGRTGSERNRLEKQNRKYRSFFFFFLPGRFLKRLNSCASVVEQTTGCNWGGFRFYF